MMPRFSNAPGRIPGLLVMVFLVADVALKNPADREEVMWACYWAAASVGVGVLLHSARLTAAGVIFLAGLGVPAWTVSVLMEGNVEMTSVLMHLMPLAIGLYAVRTAADVPKYSAPLAWLLFAIPFALAWKFCNPDAMINLSHWSRWPVPLLMPHMWLFYGLLLAGSAGMIWVAACGIRTMVAGHFADGLKTDDARRPEANGFGPLVDHRR